MKSQKYILLERILRFMAIVVLKVHKPKIVAITGSVGKTSARTAVHAVLSSRFNVRENHKNYNNEIGIPLTIIGAESGGKNIFRWLWIFLKWIFVIIIPKYPEILVLELAVDRKGDMQYFTSFIRPYIGIVTNVSLSHIEYFKTIENIAKEKGALIEVIDGDGWALLNCDDELTAKMTARTQAQVLTFGKSEDAKVNASNIVYNYQDGKPEGISFKLNYEGKNIPIRLKNILAAHSVYAALVGIAAGIIFKINLVDIASALEYFQAPSGRMNLLGGTRGSFVIDDTYNAAPMSTVAALDVLGQLQAKRKIAVLGDMLELGEQSENGHREVGRKVFSTNVDIFVAVGDRMKSAVEELIAQGFPSSKILQFDDPILAGDKILEIIQEGDFVLVKGSQGMRMEKVVEKILENPQNQKNLLCRQSKQWLNIPFAKP